MLLNMTRIQMNFITVENIHWPVQTAVARCVQISTVSSDHWLRCLDAEARRRQDCESVQRTDATVSLSSALDVLVSWRLIPTVTIQQTNHHPQVTHVYQWLRAQSNYVHFLTKLEFWYRLIARAFFHRWKNVKF